MIPRSHAHVFDGNNAIINKIINTSLRLLSYSESSDKILSI